MSRSFPPTVFVRSALLPAALGLATVAGLLSIEVAAQDQDAAEALPAAVEKVSGEDANGDDGGPAAAGTLIVSDAQTSLIQNALIAAPLSGVVATVNVSEGGKVNTNTPLARLRSDVAEKELVAAKAALDAAKLKSENDVNLRFAKRTLQVRQHELEQSQLANQLYAGAVSEMELREVQLKVEQAALAIEQAEHEQLIAAAAAVEKQAAVDVAKTMLNRHTIRAGIKGIVAEITVQPGEWVETGKPMIRVISLDPIRVECFVDGRRHGPELVGHAVRFIPTGAAAGASLRGKVSYVSPELHPVTGQVRLWATLANPNAKIGAGASGTLVVE